MLANRSATVVRAKLRSLLAVPPVEVDGTEGAWPRARREAEALLHTLRFWLAELVSAAIGGVLGGGVGAAGSPLLLFALILLALWVTAPVRQRNEARADLLAERERLAMALLPQSPKDILREFYRRGALLQHLNCLHQTGRSMSPLSAPGGMDSMNRWITEVRAAVMTHAPEHALSTERLYGGDFAAFEFSDLQVACAQIAEDLAALREAIKSL